MTRSYLLDYDDITPLPVALRAQLSELAPLRQLELVETQNSTDGTIKLRLQTLDGFPVEAVAMRHRDRTTVCVSSQSGCPLKCTFCATGTMGLGRNLEAGEIFEQVIVLAAILRDQGRKVNNVVMMGMGEPFLNYDEVLAACRLLNDPEGFGLGARQIAISTAGWIPGIERLAAEPLQLRLALSLHAPNDRLRTELMPVDRRYPLKKLMAACRDYRAATGRRIFVEYLLLDKVNDTDELAVRAGRASGPRGRVPREPDCLQPDRGRLPGFAAGTGRAVRQRAPAPRHLGHLPPLARPGHRRGVRTARRRRRAGTAAAQARRGGRRSGIIPRWQQKPWTRG